jgi:HSP20 family protein
MTSVKVRPASKRYTTISDDFDRLFNGFFNDSYRQVQAPSTTQIAVNVIQNDKNYRLELSAPGLEKEDFEIKIEKNVLTIAVNKEAKKEENVTYKRREFGVYNFTRSFRLADTIDTNAIDAKYEQGILKVALPMKAEMAPKRIEIA